MSRFDTTRWSVVLRARGGADDARAALEVLCRTYRPPVLTYIRRRGHAADAAEDLAQAFFTRFLEQASHAAADPARGRFRAFLLTAVKRFLINASVEAHAVKRGGGVRFESIDDGAGIALSGGETPEQVFERSWAAVVLDVALGRLRAETERAGKRTLFEHLREFLTEAPDEADYARVAAALHLRRNTLAVAVHRLRHRLRELVREELAETATTRSELDCEVRELRAALGSVMPGKAVIRPTHS